MPKIDRRPCLPQGAERRLYLRRVPLATCSVSDMFRKFFQTRNLFNQLLTSKLREQRRAS